MTQTQSLNQYIDYTCLDSSASYDQINELEKEAKKQAFNSICIRASWLKDFADKYRCSIVIGFPEKPIMCSSANDLANAKQNIGAVDLEKKLEETKQALEAGALELDPVIEISNLKTNPKQIEIELKTYLKTIDEYISNKEERKDSVYNLKPIFSCECLDDDELELSIKIYAQVVNEYIEEQKSKSTKSRIKFSYKNSTGFLQAAGEESPQIKKASPVLITQIAGYLDQYDPSQNIGIKAAGGIKTKEQILAAEAAANGRLTHIGSSSIDLY